MINDPSSLTPQQGSLVRVGPNEVITNDPEVLRKVMGVRSTYTRGHCGYSVRATGYLALTVPKSTTL